MLCVLFKSYLLLARPKPGSNKYEAVIIMSLRDIQLDSPDNGRGKWQMPSAIYFHLMQIRYPVSYCTVLLEACLRGRPAAI